MKQEITVNKADLLEKNINSYNSYYKLYRAEYCKKTELPMYSWKDYDYMIANGIYTRSRAKAEKVVIDETCPVGWYRLMNGYTPLFTIKANPDGRDLKNEKVYNSCE